MYCLHGGQSVYSALLSVTVCAGVWQVKCGVARVSSFKRPFSDNQKSGASAHLEGHSSSSGIRMSRRNAVQIEAAPLCCHLHPGGRREEGLLVRGTAAHCWPCCPAEIEEHVLLAEEGLMKNGVSSFLASISEPAHCSATVYW